MGWRHASALALAIGGLALAAASCDEPEQVALAEARPAAATPAPPRERPVEVVTTEVAGDLPVFVLHARPGKAKGTAIFLHGMCGHGLGYVQSFQWSASTRANVIGLQADVPCGGDGTWRKWGRDLEDLDGRIDRALGAAGLAEGRERLAIIGYSQGGTRAIELAQRFPEKYDRIVVIGAPREATARALRRAEAVVVMAGEHDAPGWRRSQAVAMERAGMRATFFELPDAVHGSMGNASERVMGEVLDWVFQ